MNRKKEFVIEVLKNIGLLDERQISEAVLEQLKTGERFTKVLTRLGFISNENIGQTLIPQLGIPPIKLPAKEAINLDLVSIVSSEFALTHRLFPIKYDMDILQVATDDPFNFIVIDNLKKITGLELDIELAGKDELDSLLNNFYIKKQKEPEFLKVSKELKESGIDSDAPIIKLVNLIIQEAVKRRSSDIHIEPLEDKLRIRYRIDGVLQELPGPPKRLQGSILSRIKIMAGMDIAEKRQPQDGRIKISIDQRELDIRVSSLPAIHGESLVMRLLDKSSFLIGLEDLGFLQDNRKDFERLIKTPNGMILVTGPTGSGKTTTLYAVLTHINQIERKVITIEDPVEYQLDGINQVQVKPQIGLTFAGGLRSMLRQAPDIIMVGEIRDFETASIAIQAALTGHLILSTLHTNDAASSVTRLIDMGIKPYLVASTLLSVLAQRLVRTICPSCRESYKLSEDEKGLLFSDKKVEENFEIYKGRGCEACDNTGYKGRIGIFELLVITDRVRELIFEQASSDLILEAAKKMGMKSLREDGFEKVRLGLTTLQEVIRVTQDV